MMEAAAAAVPRGSESAVEYSQPFGIRAAAAEAHWGRADRSAFL